jgi:adenylate kinase
MSKDDRYQTILLLGPPGAGKGTQGKILGAIPGFFHLSCGEVFRTLDVNSELGKIALQYSSRGELVPDDITIKIWEEYIHAHTVSVPSNPNIDLLILDGIPRSVNQAELMEKHIEVLRLIYLVCEDEEAILLRLRRRALQENRTDDAHEDVIRHRFQVYQQETQPVVDYYSQSIVRIVDALGTPAEILQRILEIVVPVQNAHCSHAPDLDEADGDENP